MPRSGSVCAVGVSTRAAASAAPSLATLPNGVYAHRHMGFKTHSHAVNDSSSDPSFKFARNSPAALRTHIQRGGATPRQPP